ncbi:hypothetical protein K440DRAFT_636647 [Wilcoxina mikolae CBS 423.85]|nr:hypothetical protein K440DRAFT_636647 [Wilcoxina mikolae CBS 423.85]
MIDTASKPGSWPTSRSGLANEHLNIHIKRYFKPSTSYRYNGDLYSFITTTGPRTLVSTGGSTIILTPSTTVPDILITATATTTRKLPEHGVANTDPYTSSNDFRESTIYAPRRKATNSDPYTSSNDYRGRDKYATTVRYQPEGHDSDLVATDPNRETNNPITAKAIFLPDNHHKVNTGYRKSTIYAPRRTNPHTSANHYRGPTIYAPRRKGDVQYHHPTVYAPRRHKYQYYTVSKRSHGDTTIKTTKGFMVRNTAPTPPPSSIFGAFMLQFVSNTKLYTASRLSLPGQRNSSGKQTYTSLVNAQIHTPNPSNANGNRDTATAPISFHPTPEPTSLGTPAADLQPASSFISSTDAKIFSGHYLPILLAVLLSLSWRIIDTDLRRLEPFYQLSQTSGTTLTENLLFTPLYILPVHASKRKCLLRAEPWSIAGLSTLMADGTVVEGEERLVEGYRYHLVEWTHNEDHYLAIESAQDTEPDMVISHSKPDQISPWILFAFTLFMCGILGLILAYRFTSDSLIEPFMSGQSLGVKMFFVALGIVIRSGWDPIEREARHLEVFYNLLQRHQPVSTLLIDEPRTFPMVSQISALLHGRVFIAALGMVGVLLEVLVVALSRVPYSGTQTWLDANISLFLSAGILFITIVMVGVFFFRRRVIEKKMPYVPYTIAGVMGYLYAARMLDVFSGVSILGGSKRDKVIREMTRGKRYGLGWTMRVDGKKRVGIDEEELFGSYEK